MVPTALRPSTLGIFMAATVLPSGCSASLDPHDERTEREAGRQFAERVSAIDGVTATRTLETTVDGEVRTVRTKFWARPSTGQLRSAVLAPADRAGDVTVIGNRTIWNYDERTETVTLLNVTHSRSDRLFSPDRLDDLVDRYDMDDEGETTLDGQPVHKVALRPTDETGQAPGNLTIWLDPDEQFPRKIEATYGDTVHTTVRYEDVTINPGLSSDRFRFEPPAEATVTSPSLDTQVYDQRADLVEATDLALPTPTLPDGFEFETATVADDRSVALRYANGSASLVVSSFRGKGSRVPDEAASITVDGQAGTYHAVGESKLIRWRRDGTAYSVSADLPKDRLRAVAASIES